MTRGRAGTSSAPPRLHGAQKGASRGAAFYSPPSAHHFSKPPPGRGLISRKRARQGGSNFPRWGRNAPASAAPPAPASPRQAPGCGTEGHPLPGAVPGTAGASSLGRPHSPRGAGRALPVSPDRSGSSPREQRRKVARSEPGARPLRRPGVLPGCPRPLPARTHRRSCACGRGPPVLSALSLELWQLEQEGSW